MKEKKFIILQEFNPDDIYNIFYKFFERKDVKELLSIYNFRELLIEFDKIGKYRFEKSFNVKPVELKGSFTIKYFSLLKKKVESVLKNENDIEKEKEANDLVYEFNRTFEDVAFFICLYSYITQKNIFPIINDKSIEIGFTNTFVKSSDFLDFIENIENLNSPSIKTKIRKAINNYNIKMFMKPIWENDEWKIYKINTYEEAKILGGNTNWCISSSSGEEHMERYKEDDLELYALLNKGNAEEKYILAIPSKPKANIILDILSNKFPKLDENKEKELKEIEEEFYNDIIETIEMEEKMIDFILRNAKKYYNILSNKVEYAEDVKYQEFLLKLIKENPHHFYYPYELKFKKEAVEKAFLKYIAEIRNGISVENLYDIENRLRELNNDPNEVFKNIKKSMISHIAFTRRKQTNIIKILFDRFTPTLFEFADIENNHIPFSDKFLKLYQNALPYYTPILEAIQNKSSSDFLNEIFSNFINIYIENPKKNIGNKIKEFENNTISKINELLTIKKKLQTIPIKNLAELMEQNLISDKIVNDIIRIIGSLNSYYSSGSTLSFLRFKLLVEDKKLLKKAYTDNYSLIDIILPYVFLKRENEDKNLTKETVDKIQTLIKIKNININWIGM